MAALESKLHLQFSRLELIRSGAQSIVGVAPANLTKDRINVKLELLENNWVKFEADHELIFENTKFDLIKDHDYVTKNIFSQAFKAYEENKIILQELLSKISAANPLDGMFLADQSTTVSSPIVRANLPKIDIPHFSGDYTAWRAYSDMFTSLVGGATDIDRVMKLHYLKQSVTGDAEKLISNIQVTADNFQLAWDKLVSRYENKRLILRSHLLRITEGKPLQSPTAKGLHNLIANSTEALDAIQALGVPTDQWGPMIVHLLHERLDPITKEAWAMHLAASVDIPTKEEFELFIEGRARALETLESCSSKISSTSASPKSNSHHISADTSPASNCVLCNSDHRLFKCQEFIRKSPFQRKEFIYSKRLCFNCFNNHHLKDCKSTNTCRKCQQRHHTTLHDACKKPASSSSENVEKASTQPRSGTSSLVPISTEHLSAQSQQNTSQVANVAHAVPLNKPMLANVLLATAQVVIFTPGGVSFKARALIDQGSELSFVSERLIQQLHLKRSAASVNLLGVGSTRTATTKGVVSLRLRPIYESIQSCSVRAFILPKLTSFLPSTETIQSHWPHIDGLQLADPCFHIPEKIDLILGADVYSTIILAGIKKGPPNTPVAQHTIFGWILSGSVGNQFNSTAKMNHCKVDHDLEQLLQKFWHQEEVVEFQRPIRSTEEELCEQHFVNTHSRTSSGRYIVRLPFKESPTALGKSRPIAHKMLVSQQRRLEVNPEYRKLYSDFLEEYESLHHMERVPDDVSEPNTVYYLPHHGVLRPTSSTTKLRVVFNGSARTTSGVSLNDIMHVGQKLQTDLADVLLHFRRHKYAIAADVEKMYRQILVHPDDRDLQRILWLKNDNVVTYRLCTVTYGEACAPFLSLRALNQLIQDEGDRFSQAIPMLTKGRYVDDSFGGADTIEDCQVIVDQAIQLCNAGGFPLKKWMSNHPQILNKLSPLLLANEPSVFFDSSSTVRTLGLLWKPSTDSFHFFNNSEPLKIITKRTMLSRVAQLFDPLGFIAPVVVAAKSFMQDLWFKKLDWDDPVSEQLVHKWRDFEHQLPDLSCLIIPRHLGITAGSSLEIHGFSDASFQAMSAAIYLRVSAGPNVTVRLIIAKTKLAPIKKMTIPRLELTAATLLTKLTSNVIHSMDLSSVPICLWTDSSVALAWLHSSPTKWKEFVSNRVAFVQDKLPQAKWRYVPGKQNPADCASRGISPKQLSSHKLWWNGPEWLSKNSCQWPGTDWTPPKGASVELRCKTHCMFSQVSLESELLHRYSDLMRLLRITAWCKKFINRLRRIKSDNSPDYLTSHDLHSSLLLWVNISQQTSFPKELKLLSKKLPVTNSSPLRHYNPFLDKDGMIRVGGRIDHSNLDYDTKHPYILSKNSNLSRLVIHDAHLRSLHSGTRNTLSTVRQRFWILGGRPTVRKEILKCVICTRYRQERAQQLMGQLPPSRLTPSRPFEHSGVDYAGPFNIKTWRGRSAKTYKGYVAVFICSSTSAIHLELVTDYSADAFIAAYKRFTGRRGICSTLSSDCGTTLVGADAELKRLFTASSAELKKLRSLLVNDGTQWRFNPPSAPHFGGRWEAGVKSVKYHLKRVVGDTLLTYEEFTTVLIQIEAVLNSRPLCQLTDDPDDLSVLTPGHFLTGGPLSVIPEPNLTNIKMSRLSRWQLTRQMIDSFWAKWSREYLQQQQAIYKWQFPSFNIKINSIVLIVDERYPPSKWPLARVIALHPGPDNLTRVVTLKTATTVLKRPITKLCLLPVHSKEE